MERVVSSFDFLLGSRYWTGCVEVLEAEDESGRPHIYLRMRVGRVSIKLPRVGLTEIIDALKEADASATKQFERLVEQLNRGK